MKIAITGGTGFVGTHVTKYLISKGHDVYILTRNPDKYENKERITYVGWLQDKYKPQEELPTLNAIVHLAGENLNSGRWTESRKEKILQSRLKGTEAVIDLIRKMEHKPDVLINASAIGYYGTSETKMFTENTTTSGDDFLAHVVEKWENTATQAKELGVRTALLRFGVILGEEGALQKMAMPYKFMAGGTLGNGEQWMSWIHIDDIVGLIDFSIREPNASGAINATAPNPKRNKEFGQLIGKVLNRPHWIPAPTFALQLLLGEMSTLVLEGQYVYPQKALELGYTFQYPELKPALENIFSKKGG
ncbi:TIGR01777 family oxidoreductase [Pontibacillus litoralis]|uniref:Multidrug MFS transporter n=1 Tax=Pontibacillus litoralis JSM 072002 TaxID=1385512 RepID=A0A0A5GAJ2_9BACI|nr:TIGR01777 family oxidoreductase [Pontibacillus litoralis]KGX88130.1 multidrug MFS transporter [Pontibacillus litoralis JSM 072002]